eukprot:Nk52_evm38s255 gene=Nk52_evmTU38s255
MTAHGYYKHSIPASVFGRREIGSSAPMEKKEVPPNESSSFSESFMSEKMALRVNDVSPEKFLIHASEAKKWFEDSTAIAGGSLLEFMDSLKYGTFLGHLAIVYQENDVKKSCLSDKDIYDSPDQAELRLVNVDIFLSFLRKVGLPHMYWPNANDTVMGADIPKIIYCIHALARHLQVKHAGNAKITVPRINKLPESLKSKFVESEIQVASSYLLSSEKRGTRPPKDNGTLQQQYHLAPTPSIKIQHSNLTDSSGIKSSNRSALKNGQVERYFNLLGDVERECHTNGRELEFLNSKLSQYRKKLGDPKVASYFEQKMYNSIKRVQKRLVRNCELKFKLKKALCEIQREIKYFPVGHKANSKYSRIFGHRKREPIVIVHPKRKNFANNQLPQSQLHRQETPFEVSSRPAYSIKPPFMWKKPPAKRNSLGNISHSDFVPSILPLISDLKSNIDEVLRCLSFVGNGCASPVNLASSDSEEFWMNALEGQSGDCGIEFMRSDKTHTKDLGSRQKKLHTVQMYRSDPDPYVSAFGIPGKVSLLDMECGLRMPLLSNSHTIGNNVNLSNCCRAKDWIRFCSKTPVGQHTMTSLGSLIPKKSVNITRSHFHGIIRLTEPDLDGNQAVNLRSSCKANDWARYLTHAAVSSTCNAKLTSEMNVVIYRTYSGLPCTPFYKCLLDLDYSTRVTLLYKSVPHKSEWQGVNLRKSCKMRDWLQFMSYIGHNDSFNDIAEMTIVVYRSPKQKSRFVKSSRSIADEDYSARKSLLCFSTTSPRLSGVNLKSCASTNGWAPCISKGYLAERNVAFSESWISNRNIHISRTTENGLMPINLRGCCSAPVWIKHMSPPVVTASTRNIIREDTSARRWYQGALTLRHYQKGALSKPTLKTFPWVNLYEKDLFRSPEKYLEHLMYDHLPSIASLKVNLKRACPTSIWQNYCVSMDRRVQTYQLLDETMIAARGNAKAFAPFGLGLVNLQNSCSGKIWSSYMSTQRPQVLNRPYAKSPRFTRKPYEHHLWIAKTVPKKFLCPAPPLNDARPTLSRYDTAVWADMVTPVQSQPKEKGPKLARHDTAVWADMMTPVQSQPKEKGPKLDRYDTAVWADMMTPMQSQPKEQGPKLARYDTAVWADMMTPVQSQPKEKGPKLARYDTAVWADMMTPMQSQPKEQGPKLARYDTAVWADMMSPVQSQPKEKGPKLARYDTAVWADMMTPMQSQPKEQGPKLARYDTAEKGPKLARYDTAVWADMMTPMQSQPKEQGPKLARYDTAVWADMMTPMQSQQKEQGPKLARYDTAVWADMMTPVQSQPKEKGPKLARYDTAVWADMMTPVQSQPKERGPKLARFDTAVWADMMTPVRSQVQTTLAPNGKQRQVQSTMTPNGKQNSKALDADYRMRRTLLYNQRPADHIYSVSVNLTRTCPTNVWEDMMIPTKWVYNVKLHILKPLLDTDFAMRKAMLYYQRPSRNMKYASVNLNGSCPEVWISFIPRQYRDIPMATRHYIELNNNSVYVLFPKRDIDVVKQKHEQRALPLAVPFCRSQDKLLVKTIAPCLYKFLNEVELFSNYFNVKDGVLLNSALITREDAMKSTFNLSGCAFKPADIARALPGIILSHYGKGFTNDNRIDVRKFVKTHYESFSYVNSANARIHVLGEGWDFVHSINESPGTVEINFERDCGNVSNFIQQGHYCSYHQILKLSDNVPFCQSFFNACSAFTVLPSLDFFEHAKAYKAWNSYRNQLDGIPSCTTIIKQSDALKSSLFSILSLSEQSVHPVSPGQDYFADLDLAHSYAVVFREDYTARKIILGDVAGLIRQGRINRVNEAYRRSNYYQMHPNEMSTENADIVEIVDRTELKSEILSRKSVSIQNVSDWHQCSGSIFYRELPEQMDDDLWRNLLSETSEDAQEDYSESPREEDLDLRRNLLCDIDNNVDGVYTMDDKDVSSNSVTFVSHVATLPYFGYNQYHINDSSWQTEGDENNLRQDDQYDQDSVFLMMAHSFFPKRTQHKAFQELYERVRIPTSVDWLNLSNSALDHQQMNYEMRNGIPAPDDLEIIAHLCYNKEWKGIQQISADDSLLPTVGSRLGSAIQGDLKQWGSMENIFTKKTDTEARPSSIQRSILGLITDNCKRTHSNPCLVSVGGHQII